MLLWELAIQTSDVTEDLSAAFLLLDGAAEGVPSFQGKRREEEEEGRKKRGGDRKEIVPLETCPGVTWETQASAR